MPTVIELSSWAEFEKRQRNNLYSDTKDWKSAPTIYRGQSDATWPLETTLERAIGKKESVISYYSDITDMQPQLETFTNNKWGLPSVR